MTSYEVESIGVVSLAKILGVMGLLWGILMTIFSLFVGMGTGMMGGGLMGGVEIMVWLVGGPLYGAVVGAVTAIVYNAAASLIGGIELELA